MEECALLLLLGMSVHATKDIQDQTVATTETVDALSILAIMEVPALLIDQATGVNVSKAPQEETVKWITEMSACTIHVEKMGVVLTNQETMIATVKSNIKARIVTFMMNQLPEE